MPHQRRSNSPALMLRTRLAFGLALCLALAFAIYRADLLRRAAGLRPKSVVEFLKLNDYRLNDYRLKPVG
jgi:hypothetical protein